MRSLGENIKTIRLQQHMTLNDLSRQCGVSKSQLSQIERSVSVPTVTKIQAVAKALGVTLSELLPESQSNGDPDNGDARGDDNHLRRVKKIGVVRRNGRKKLMMPWGASYEMLCPDLQRKIEFIVLHYPAGVEVDESYSHDGEECGLILEGTFKGTFGDEEIILKPGDSICYDSSIQHKWEAVGDRDVKAIWVITPPSF